MYFDPLRDCAKSTEKALKRYIQYTLLNHKTALAIGFDCSWSYIRNANQASGELIYQDILIDYSHKPIIAFHEVSPKATIPFIKKILTKPQGKWNMLLIEVLNQITPLLEEAELHLEIYIDGDLDLNKTLADQKNVQFHAFEDHIMRWFYGCIYSAAFRRAAQNHDAPSENEADRRPY
ncbi:hypothetical protein C2G38_2225604 [Gigaspora rosea]|uniref:Uncharacterized protein n=1 Tax=Gigaspora rosea TaxID=44941 RepID=A0A397TZ98_9GLOM|nr:hypothetical protein C2G38_2225604 [Gigaspora rosea]